MIDSVAASSERAVVEVSAAEVALRAAVDLLPTVPADVTAMNALDARRQRPPNLHETRMCRWLCVMDGEHTDSTMLGLLGYRHTFDFHSYCDVIEVVHLVGDPRSVHALTASIVEIARARDLPVVGTIALGNLRMGRYLARRCGMLLARLGFWWTPWQ